MSSKQLRYLRDILESSTAIRTYLAGQTLQSYAGDRRNRRAVERELQILTEAVFRLGNSASLLCPEVDWRSLRGLGNFLRHQYDDVDDEIIWDVVQNQLPAVTAAVERAVLAAVPSADPKP